MDPVLTSLFPVHQIGADGFNWWIGQVESNKNDDPKNSGRYRVRIVGQHLKQCDATPTEELPWANVMMPVTSPWSDGGVTGASVNLNQGNWVIGFYLDNDKQKPIIMGSVGHTAGATLLKNVEEDPNPGETCKSFTTFLSPDRNPYKHEPLPEKDKTNGTVEAAVDSATAAAKSTTIGQAGLPANAVPEKHAANFYALFSQNTDTNPLGGKICVEIANPKCGSESDLKGNLKNILGDMLASNQQSGGQLGSYYVSKINGQLTSYADVGRYHVNRAIRLVKSFLARVKGEIVKSIREGVDYLVKTALTTEVAAEDALGNTNTGPVNPDLGIKPFEPIVKRENRLKKVQEFLDKTLGELGCSIEDLTDKIAQWLTDLLLGYLMDAFNAAACLVDTLVNGIINEILSLLETLISTVLGPLQQILSVLAEPLNIIGSAINSVLGLLGISCDGPSDNCQKVTKECTECDTEEKEDWLDDLINQIENGPSSAESVCSDAKKYPKPKNTVVVPVGGIFAPTPGSSIPGSVSSEDNTPIRTAVDTISYSSSDIEVVEGTQATFTITRSGNLTYSSSITYTTRDINATYGDDYIGSVSGSIGFAPGERTKQVSFRTFRDYNREGDEEFVLIIRPSVTPTGIIPRLPNGTYFKCKITDFTSENFGPDDGTPRDTPSTVGIYPVVPTTSISNNLPLYSTYNILTDKPLYYNGETIAITILTTNVEDNTVLNYELSGTIDSSDIDGDLTGSFTVIENQATVNIKLTDNGDVSREKLVFDILNTPASKSITIIGDDIERYFVSADKNFAFEGDTIQYTINTSNVPDETQVSYTITGIQEDDIQEDLTGTVTIINSTATVAITVVSDNIVENSELLTFSLDDKNASVDTVILSDIGSGGEDTDPRFAVTTDKLQYEEGETVIYSISTVNIPDGTILQYSLFGNNITSSDIFGGNLYGSFIVIDNQAKVYVRLEEDSNIEQSEVMTFTITGTGASADVIINDGLEEEITPDSPVSNPCLTAPVFGEPITDSNGSIISIPIVNTGCPYDKEPQIIINGNGYGASAIALLDKNGYVSEVRVTKTGINYVKNLPSSNLICIIDSFTLINPGRGYTSEPKIYINGVENLARAKVNSDGYVFSVEILDRSTQYYELPEITIIGGGGSGAKVLPNIVCRDPLQLEEIGYAKIGTGKYIDCP